MKKTWLVGAVMAALTLAHAGVAADLGTRVPGKAPPALAPVPMFSWTGCYVGGHVGGGWGEKRVSAPALAPGISATGDTSGFLGGGQIGCNLQIGSNWVIGFEGEASAADVDGDITRTVLGITGTAHAQTDWLASATGRIGWSWDRWLIYAKGGAAWVGDKYSAFIPVFNESLAASETRTGWTIGAGLEWAFWNNWSAKAEYNYYDFGTETLTLTGTFAGAPIIVPGIDVRQRISVGKLGINYRF
jgi:outer membrane immunogenic protein